MNASFKDRLNYKVERFMSKGGSSIFVSLLVLFLATFVLIIGIRLIFVVFFPDLDYKDNFFYDIWIIFLQMTDPGNMNQDNDSPTWLKLTTILAGLSGVIILSMLIAFITTSLEKMLYEFRKGRGKVLETDQTLILGWNERVIDIVRELIIANESEKKASVVVLSNEEKEIMDDMIQKRLPNPKTTSIVTTKGDYANINELNRVNLHGAKSVIILANCTEGAGMEEKILSDVQTVKSIMAIISCQKGENHIPIIAEIFTEEKRELVESFDDENIIAIDSWDIMGKLLVQTSLTSGLEIVYNEILSFDGCEIYFYGASWNNVLWKNMAYHFKDGVPLGIYNEEEGLVLRPEPDRAMKNGDQILIVAEDDSTINFESKQFITPTDIELSDKKLEQKQKDILILGWHDVAKIFIREANDYLAAGTKIDIMFNEPTEELENIVNGLKEEYPKFTVSLTNADPLRRQNLEEVEPFKYDNVIILSQDMTEQSADKIDSDTLIILLLLRNINKEGEEQASHIITQVLNSENQDIITQTDVDDFIISNKLITMILAQLSEEPQIKLFYDDIFQEDGSEIYVKPADLYFTSFPQKIRFADAMGVANKREEICIGIRYGRYSKSPDRNFGVKLNLAKDEMIEITEDDYLVVLAEDEL